MGKAEDKRKDKERALLHRDERRRVVLRVFQGCDETTAQKLTALAEKGVVTTCRAGCSHCCSSEVPVTRAEGETLAAWLVEHRSPEELEAIRARLRAWLAWYRGAYLERVATMPRVEVFFRHGPPCVLLEDDRCSAYPVRPVACRNLYVSSPPSVCDPAVGSGNPDSIDSIARATYDHVVEIRRTVERQGGNFLASVHRLPEWLAHLLEVESEPWRGAPRLELGV